MADTAAFRAAVLEDVARFTAAMPKFELHAHINGSIPLAVLQQFAAADVVAETEAESQNGGAAGNHNKLTSKSAAQCVADDVSVFMTPLGPEATPSDRMAHCFKVFDVVYKLVRTRERLVAATRAVVRSFADEGCAYLELRTTPKGLPDGTTDEGYVVAVLEAIREEMRQAGGHHAGQAQPVMKCNLLLSINRRVSPAAAQRVIDLALRFRDETFATATTSNTALPAAAGAAVVGIDFCGDCYANTFAEFVPALRRAKDNGLPVTLHMGEKQDDAEVQQMVAFGPDRVGHCVFVSDSAREALRTRQVPVEVCITSNMLTGGLTEAKDHHVAEWLRGGNDHPVTINTDDSSVFSTTLCRELSLFAEIWFELFVARRRDVARKETATTSDSAVATRQAAVRFILGELWRVQFHAAKCAFVPRESDRAELLALLNATHEAAWRAQGWWCADA